MTNQNFILKPGHLVQALYKIRLKETPGFSIDSTESTCEVQEGELFLITSVAEDIDSPALWKRKVKMLYKGRIMYEWMNVLILAIKYKNIQIIDCD
jgi:hypothetical protein